ncbi:MAG: extracellular solute-binding protein [Alphaproteobacteria bacterium]|nr:extracellular solute-binding protein [Alphaproteobacteria bacterium]
MNTRNLYVAAAALGIAALAGSAQAQTLRLLTWGGYAPEAVVKQFKAETGIDVAVTESNNEDMISKLRATDGAGFDLAQPSQDRITGAQQEFGIYKPIDYAKLNAALFNASMLEASRKNTTLDGKPYGVAHVWGTLGIVVDKSKAPDIKDYADLCDPKYKGRISMRLKRPDLIAMAFAVGEDPFAAYGDKAKYQAIIDKAGQKLIDCKPNVKAYWTGSDALLNLFRTGEVVAAIAWDASGFKLNQENASINFLVPAKSQAQGWIDTFALPKKGRADDAAYKWINFVMQPKVAAAIAEASGSFTASKGSEDLVSPGLSKAFKAAFSDKEIAAIKWYPTVPAGLEAMEGKVLDRAAAAK